jgi:hypothetical protein
MENQKTIRIAAILTAALLIAGLSSAVTVTPMSVYATMDTIRTAAMLAKLSQNKSSIRKMLVVEIQTIVTVDKTQLRA